MKRPNSAANLIKAIKRYCGVNQDDIRLARAMADVIVGQMLPAGVVKGGSSLMFRYGGAVTRYTKDVDTARSVELEAYLESLRLKLAEGWNGFTGKIVDVEPPSPPNVPKPYLMMPYDIKLQYQGKSWMTVRIEVGHNEIGDADAFETMLPDDIAAAFVDLGFPKPNEIPVMKLSYQVAQKLHAVSGINSDRAHDLIDLQLIDKYSILDLVDVRSKCERLFKYRCEQAWPPVIIKGDRWSSVYNEAYTTLRKPEMVLSAVDDAIEWVNEFVNRIVKA
jgi:hypothetical protein